MDYIVYLYYITSSTWCSGPISWWKCLKSGMLHIHDSVICRFTSELPLQWCQLVCFHLQLGLVYIRHADQGGLKAERSPRQLRGQSDSWDAPLMLTKLIWQLTHLLLLSPVFVSQGGLFSGAPLCQTLHRPRVRRQNHQHQKALGQRWEKEVKERH